jgi:hypothetical protein
MRVGALANRFLREAAPRVPFGELSDEEAWEEFDSIRFARYAGGR